MILYQKERASPAAGVMDPTVRIELSVLEP
jgi:hypothetical protein